MDRSPGTDHTAACVIAAMPVMHRDVGEHFSHRIFGSYSLMKPGYNLFGDVVADGPRPGVDHRSARQRFHAHANAPADFLHAVLDEPVL
jgi:hypothetical protein